MTNLSTLPSRDDDGHVRAVVETPRGANVKLKLDPHLGAFTMSRPLVLGLSYPYDWGFIPSTLAPDGDPLDAMVLFDGSTYPGVVLTCRALGVVKISQKAKTKRGAGAGSRSAPARERNDRLILTPTTFPRFDDVRGTSDLPKRVRDEIAQFFVTAVFFANKDVKVEGWGSAREAMRLLADAERRYRASK